MEKMQISKEGREKLESELDYLIHVARPENLEQLTAARAQGDLSENADYDAARNKQAEIEGRIAEIQHILDNSEVSNVKKSKKQVVQFGSKVTIVDLSEEDEVETTYDIVNTIESNIMENKISVDTPLVKALLGHGVGETVSVKTPEIIYEVKIIDIK